jgi:hypothetical protein
VIVPLGSSLLRGVTRPATRCRRLLLVSGLLVVEHLAQIALIDRLAAFWALVASRIARSVLSAAPPRAPPAAPRAPASRSLFVSPLPTHGALWLPALRCHVVGRPRLRRRRRRKLTATTPRPLLLLPSSGRTSYEFPSRGRRRPDTAPGCWRDPSEGATRLQDGGL